MLVYGLVSETIEAGRKLVAVLEEKGIPVQGAYWVRIGDDYGSSWRLVIGSEYVDRVGGLEAYRKLGQIIESQPGLSGFGPSDISFWAPQDFDYKRYREQLLGRDESRFSPRDYAREDGYVYF